MFGIHLSKSTNNVISCNDVSENDAGISFESASDHNVLTDNTVLHNSKNGIFQSNSFDNNIFNNSISNNQYGIYFDTMSTFNSVSSNQVFMNTKDGIYIHNSFNNSLSENSVFLNSECGINIDSSINNVLSKNNISSNNRGVTLFSSIGNVLLDNNVSSNSEYGIFSSEVSNNTISDNVVSSSGYGIFLYYSKNNDVLNNMVFSNLEYGIFVDYSNENTVSGNTIFSNDYGIKVCDSSSNVLFSNSVSNNTHGILVDSSSFNTLKDNTLWENLYGMGLSTPSADNTIVHNNFNNINQFFYENYWISMDPNIWDNGAEGNYWSDYKTKYPNATEKDHSGIWDTKYVIDENNTDNCCLVKNWNQTRYFDVPWGQKDFTVTTQSDATIAGIDFNQTKRQCSITVTAPMGKEQYCNITIPKELLDATADNWTIIHSREVPFIIVSNATHTSLYFTFDYSTNFVNVKGTNPVDMVKPHAATGPDQTVTEGTNVIFDGSASSDDVATPFELTYIWTINDTIPQTLSGPSPQHVFTKPGTYEVTLEVTDLRGNSDTSKVTITVLAIPIWAQQWFLSGTVGTAATALVAVFPILRYYRSFKKQRRIVLEYESELETLPLLHLDRVRARYIKDDIERKKKIEEFQKRYGIKIRPAASLEDAMNRLGIPMPVERSEKTGMIPRNSAHACSENG
jgi:parallel beta-helix repeat protein